MKNILLLLTSLLITSINFAQITLEPNRVGINSDAPAVTLEVFDSTTLTEVKIRNANVSRLSIDGGSPNLQWLVAGDRKAFANWGNNALRIYSSPPTPPPFSFNSPTLNLTEDRKVGINMGLAGNPTEALDVNGRIKVGNTADSSAQAGTIRWNALAQDFEGFDGIEWLSLTAGAEPAVNPGGVGKITNVQQLGAPMSGVISAFSLFGYDVAISNDRAVAGGVDVFSLGYAACYEKIGAQWQEVQQITPADVDTSERFGFSVAMNGDWMAVGAPLHHVDFDNQGAVYIYKHDGSQWNQHQKLTLSNPKEGDLFGASLEIKGTQLFVGAQNRENPGNVNTGALMVYNLVGGSWALGFTYYPVAGQANEGFGSAVAMNGNHLVVGAPYKEINGTERGVAYIYDRNGSLYLNQEEIHLSTYYGSQTGPRFGQAVATSDGTMAATRRTGGIEISVWKEDSNNDHQLLLDLPYKNFFDASDPKDRVYRDVDMEGDFLIMGLGGFDGGNDCNQIMDGVGKIVVMKRQGEVWLKCDEYLDPSGTPDQGAYMSVAITPDGQFIIGLPYGSYGDKVIFGEVAE